MGGPEPVDIPLPRYDYYQTPTHVILAVYIKGQSPDQVSVSYTPTTIVIVLPDDDGPLKKRVKFDPLYAPIHPDQTTHRVLSSKIEIKLAKATADNWAGILSTGSQSPNLINPPASFQPASSTLPPAVPAETAAPAVSPDTATPGPSGRTSKPKKNWDKIEDQDDEDGGSKDPNAGGDAALQKLFSSIYANASDDTKRAMIKSFTESGGTTLSTDWDSIGKEKTPIRPPEGMEPRFR